MPVAMRVPFFARGAWGIAAMAKVVSEGNFCGHFSFLISGIGEDQERERLRWSVLWSAMLVMSLTGLLYLCTGGFLLIGVLYDFWTLNQQVSEVNHTQNARQ